MIDYQPLFSELEGSMPADQSRRLQELTIKHLDPRQNKDISSWETAIRQLPHRQSVKHLFNADTVSIIPQQELTAQELTICKQNLMALHPWRKGPFNLLGITIDAEWRSNLKWDRLAQKIEPLSGRRVLDIGCGNGYYGYRMLGAGAELVLGVEPFLKNVYQYFAVSGLAGPQPFFVLPMGIEDLPSPWEWFDTVFSMGVFYHRRSPFDHLLRLKSFLKPGGQLVLETLVIEGHAGQVLVPPNRYAKMRNVWFIPSPPTLISWLERSGFKQVHVLDVSVTTTNEQRPTEWMRFESLPDFLDKNNPGRTIEGLPAPRRALFTAIK